MSEWSRKLSDEMYDKAKFYYINYGGFGWRLREKLWNEKEKRSPQNDDPHHS